MCRIPVPVTVAAESVKVLALTVSDPVMVTVPL